MADYADRYWTSKDGLKLHYRDYAGPHERPPILCLPGLTRNARDFEPLAERYAGEWRVIAVEFRGRGLSEHDPNPANYVPPTYAADVMKLLDQLGIADAVFVGTSLGGLVTMLVALTDSERVAGAVINDVGPVIEPAAIERLRTYVGKDGEWSTWAEAAAGAADINRIAFPDYGDSEWEAFARRLCREDADGKIRRDYDMAIAEPFATSNGTPPVDPWRLINGLVDVPVTILRGELSDLFSAETARQMADSLPRSELVIVPGIGHAPILDEPTAVAALDRLLGRVLER